MTPVAGSTLPFGPQTGQGLAWLSTVLEEVVINVLGELCWLTVPTALPSRRLRRSGAVPPIRPTYCNKAVADDTPPAPSAQELSSGRLAAVVPPRPDLETA